METLVRLLLRPQVMVLLGALLFGAIFGTHGSGTFSSDAKGDGANNPWSKNYDSAAAERRAAERGPHSNTYAYTVRDASGRSRPVSAAEADELRRDEEYRRNLLREMRKEHEAEGGGATTDLDGY